MLENGMVLEMDRHLNDLAKQELPVCPECGGECQTIYLLDGEVLGCENCWDDLIVKVDAWDWQAKQER